MWKLFDLLESRKYISGENQEATTPSSLPQTKQRSFLVILTITCAAITVEASSTLAGELSSLSRATHSVGVTTVSSCETWVLLWLPS